MTGDGEFRVAGPPVIGVTGPDRGGGAAWLFTWLAVSLAGGHAVRITPRRPHSIRGLDGLILGGGADVDPELYGGMIPTPTAADARQSTRLAALLGYVLYPLTFLARKLAARKSAAPLDLARDRLELTLLRQAVARGLPVLGICRGAQLINVQFGGSLHQSLEGFYVEDPAVRTILPRRRIDLARGSRIRRIAGRATLRVNALHRQAIDRLGAGLRIAAHDRNGIVQSIEHESAGFIVGVQWHPEYLPQLPEQRALFVALVGYARQRRQRLSSPQRRSAGRGRTPASPASTRRASFSSRFNATDHPQRRQPSSRHHRRADHQVLGRPRRGAGGDF